MTTDAAAVDLLQACGLPARWRGRERFVVLAAGAIGVSAFRAAWKMWRDDPDRCGHLHVIVLGSPWPAPEDLAVTILDDAVAEVVGSSSPSWPPPTPDLHRLAFEAGRVQLLVVPEASTIDWREIVASVDAFLIDRTADGTGLLVDSSRSAKSIARTATTHAIFAGTGIDASAQKSLEATGFRFDAPMPAAAGIARAVYEPTFVPKRPAGRKPPSTTVEKRVVVIGAGLAGCAVAWALAEHGWCSTVLERHASIAGEASGNPAGLFHGIVNGQDGMHARFNRAAALEAQRAVGSALAHHGVGGAVCGLLQLVDADRSAQSMRALLLRLRLPAGYVQALDAEQAGALAGLPLARPAWFYPGGGWVDPRGLARAFLARAGASVEVRFGAEVVALHRGATQWHILDSGGREIERASTVVLANAGEALRLAGGNWPVEKVRGQLSMLSMADSARVALPRLPITGSGYVLPATEGRMIFGATTAPADDDPAVRFTDHLQNLEQLACLAPSIAAGIDPDRLQGRTAWRWVSRDRLPLIGAVPLVAADGSPEGADLAERTDQVRFIARQPGLFVFTALGSRGITWCALGALVLAASITGAPVPVGASLLDAIDPARFRVRASRVTNGLAR